MTGETITTIVGNLTASSTSNAAYFWAQPIANGGFDLWKTDGNTVSPVFDGTSSTTATQPAR